MNKPYIKLLIPAIIILLTLGVYPVVYCFYISFHKYTLLKQSEVNFIGIDNYIKIFSEKTFLTSVGITLAFTLLTVILEFSIGFAIALFLNRNFRGVGAIVVGLSLPVLFPSALSSVMFKYMFSPLGGVIYYTLNHWFKFSRESAALLSHAKGAFLALVINDMWQWTPFVALVLLYGLLTVPTDVLEAAKIDGASSFQILKNVSLPSIRPFILTILLLRTMDCFKVFDIVFPLTYGGPGLSTTTLSFNIYLNAFAILDIGTSSAMAVIMLAIITILAQMYIRIVYRGEKI